MPYFILWMLDFFNTIRMSNSLDPDQAGCFVGPDLGPNCLQRLSIDDKSCNVLSLLIRVQTVCKGYQPKGKVAASKNFKS